MTACLTALRSRNYNPRSFLPKSMSFPSKWDNDWVRCCEYAEAEFSTIKHTRRQRGQCNMKRIKHQAAIGKFGEILACDFLRHYGHDCTFPDFEVYTSKNKSWESDLFVEKHKIACKTQDMASARRYGHSWVFQKNGYGRGHTDPVLQDDLSLCMFVTVSPEKRLCTVNGPYRMCDLKSYFKEPTVASLRFSKTCLYWDDIKNLAPYKIKKIN